MGTKVYQKLYFKDTTMTTKAVLEEAIHKIEKEIQADEAWIEYIDGEVRVQNDAQKSISARLDEIEAKMDRVTRIMEDLGRAIDVIRS